MTTPPRLRAAFYRAWRHLPQRLRAAAVRVAVPRAPVGAAVLLFDQEGRVLLVRQSYQRGTSWTLPGGWAKRNEDLRNTARREVREELGVDVVIGDPLAAGRGLFNDVTVVFEAEWKPVDGASIGPLDAEISEARFFALDELPPLFGHARRLIADALPVRQRRR